MNELALFAGVGGGILGGLLCGFCCVCAVEIDPYARAVLAARQNDGTLKPFPIWDDIRTFSGEPWRGIIDVVSGGFPCQDISVAGKGAGIDGAKSGLWREMARVICEVEPRFVIVENSPALLVRGFGTVLGDLAAMGFDAKWGVFGAYHVGAPHKRERLFIVATHPDRERQQEQRRPQSTAATLAGSERDHWWTSEPDVLRVADGLPVRVDRIRGLGNAQVPSVVKLAWDTLTRAGGK